MCGGAWSCCAGLLKSQRPRANRLLCLLCLPPPPAVIHKPQVCCFHQEPLFPSSCRARLGKLCPYERSLRWRQACLCHCVKPTQQCVQAFAKCTAPVMVKLTSQCTSTASLAKACCEALVVACVLSWLGLLVKAWLCHGVKHTQH